MAHDSPIQIQATYAKSSWIKYWVLGLLNVGTGGAGSAADGISHWPSVVVLNKRGERRQLEKFDSNEEADARAIRIRADLEILGLEGWCERYDVRWISSGNRVIIPRSGAGVSY
jgi:hypothetical protein